MHSAIERAPMAPATTRPAPSGCLAPGLARDGTRGRSADSATDQAAAGMSAHCGSVHTPPAMPVAQAIVASAIDAMALTLSSRSLAGLA